MIATRIDTLSKTAQRTIRLRLRAEGRAAFAGHDTTPEPPYAPDTQAYREWLHGWWSVYYGIYCAGCGDKHAIQACPVIHAALFAADPPGPPPEDPPIDRPRANITGGSHA